MTYSRVCKIHRILKKYIFDPKNYDPKNPKKDPQETKKSTLLILKTVILKPPQKSVKS